MVLPLFSHGFPLVSTIFPWPKSHGFSVRLEATSAVDMAKLAASQVAPDGSKICHGAQGRGILSMALTTDWWFQI